MGACGIGPCRLRGQRTVIGIRKKLAALEGTQQAKVLLVLDELEVAGCVDTEFALQSISDCTTVAGRLLHLRVPRYAD